MIPPYRPNFRHSNFDAEYSSIPVNIKEFDRTSVSCNSRFSQFDYNLTEEYKSRMDFSSASTSCSRNVNNTSSQVVEEYNSTKVKVFMPTVSPKVFNLKDVPEGSYMTNRKYKDASPSFLSVDGFISSRNLVQELRPPFVRKPLRNKKDKPQEFKNEVPEPSDDHSYANEIPEFLKKVELSK